MAEFRGSWNDMLEELRRMGREGRQHMAEVLQEREMDEGSRRHFLNAIAEIDLEELDRANSPKAKREARAIIDRARTLPPGS